MQNNYLYHRNQDHLDTVNPVIDRSKIHGVFEGKDGKFYQEIGDECFEIKLTEEQKQNVRQQKTNTK